MQTIKVEQSDIICVTAAVLSRNNQVLIAQRKSTDRLAGCWEFPGGKLEKGESPRACLRRELKEELGIETQIGSFLGESLHHYPHGAIKLMVYRVYWKGGHMVVNDHACIKWVATAQLKQYDFAPADEPFVQLVSDGSIALEND